MPAVPRIRFAARRTTEKEGELTIGRRLFREVVVDDEDIFALVHEIFSDGNAGERRKVVERGRSRCGGVNDDGVAHRALFAELLGDTRGLGLLLADRDVDTNRA